jgi:L-threonylcarbamoyladenylate synthase
VEENRNFSELDIVYHETRLLRTGDWSSITLAAERLQRGEAVVFPTDTVYGIGVNPYDEAAINRLYAIKGRPMEKGIPILLADPGDLAKVAAVVPAVARLLIERFWPGALTLIVPKLPALPARLSPNETIAVRIPDLPVARALIRAAGGAVATTSANYSGQNPSTSGLEAMSVFRGVVAIVLDDGPSPGSVPSTIVDCTTPVPVIRREGILTAADLGIRELLS